MPEPEPEPVEEDTLEISIEGSMGSQFSISGGETPSGSGARAAAGGGVTAAADSSEEVLEIDGSVEIGSDILLADDTPVSEKAAAQSGDDDAAGADDAISFEDGDMDGLLEGDVEIELSASDADGAAAAVQIPRAFSEVALDRLSTFVPSASAAPVLVSKNGDLDSADLERVSRWLAGEQGTLSEAEDESGMSYKREFIMYLQKRAGELPDGAGVDFLRNHGINGKVDSIRKARSKLDLLHAYTDWKRISELYERGPDGKIKLKKPRQEYLREKFGRKKGDDAELDELDDLLGPDTPPPTSKPKSFAGSSTAGSDATGSGIRTLSDSGTGRPSSQSASSFGSFSRTSQPVLGGSAATQRSGCSAKIMIFIYTMAQDNAIQNRNKQITIRFSLDVNVLRRRQLLFGNQPERHAIAGASLTSAGDRRVSWQRQLHG